MQEAGKVSCQVIPPPKELIPFVRYFWTLEVPDAQSEPFQAHSFVDDSAGLIFSNNAGLSPALVQNGEALKHDFFYGQHTDPSTTVCHAGISIVAVLFHPYAIKELYGVDAHYLTDEFINTYEFISWNIKDAIFEQREPLARVKILSDYFIGKLTHEIKSDALVKDCIQYIKRSGSPIAVKDIIRHYRISERQLERRVLNLTGVSPRHYIKVIRFNKALQLLKRGDFKKLSDIAYKLNYSDQAHFYRNIKELSGFCPRLLQQKVDSAMFNLILEENV